MKTRFKGHETFYFREGWLSKALLEIHANNNAHLFSSNNGIAKLGVGANMVKSIKYWLLATNLIIYDRQNRNYILTPLGELIAQEDVYLEDYFTLWILHINLVRNKEEATTWNLFFNYFGAEQFQSDIVKKVLRDYLLKNEIKFAEKSLDADINILLNMYTKPKEDLNPEENLICPLSQLDILAQDKNEFIRTQPNLDHLDDLVILYAIRLMIDEKDNHINISELEHGENSLTKLFHLNRVSINEYLDSLAAQKYLHLAKTAGLDSLYFDTKLSAFEIVREYYERRNIR